MKNLKQKILKQANRIVIKIGTHVLTNAQGALDTRRIAHLVEQIDALSSNHRKQFILVSSGAVGAAMGKLGILRRPQSLPDIQALAAVGQSLVIETYRRAFNRHGVEIGQLLLTKDDFQNRTRYLNIANTLGALLDKGIIPIINENDTVATDEITFGDNDQLCSLVSHTVHADLVIILSTIDGLINQENKTVIPYVEEINKDIHAHIQDKKTGWGIGGMKSKIKAISQIVGTGEPVILANGKKTNILSDIFNGEERGTLFRPAEVKLRRKKRWIAFFAKPSGDIHVDEGAMNALTRRNSSLLAIGIREIEGRFNRGAVVRICYRKKEVARGLINYSASDLDKIKGLKSPAIQEVLGNKIYGEVIHKDNLVISANP